MEVSTQELLVTLARSLNRKVDPGSTLDRGSRPGDAYAARTSWADILQPAGWEKVRQDATLSYWRRPGKSGRLWSATTGPRGEAGDLLYVFSSSCSPFEPSKSYSKFAAYTLLHHGGDYAAAARELVRLGYGTGRRPDANGTNGTHHANGKAAPPQPAPPPKTIFPRPIPASQLKIQEGAPWLWNGYLAAGAVTMLSALWKAGKTTLLAHLLREMERGGEFCGRALAAGRVLYVTEESESRWAKRRDRLGLRDHVSFVVRPFRGKSDWSAWNEFTIYLTELVAADPVDLVVLDPLVNLWPVRDENDNAQVLSALLPLQPIVSGRSGLLLCHHFRKADGDEGTASRGGGSFMGFVDTIMELRRNPPGDRRRVLRAYGRDDETPEELVIELTDQGYVALGERTEVAMTELLPVIARLLPASPPGLTRDEVLACWPEGVGRPGTQRLIEALHRGASAGMWVQGGEGRRGSPWRFCRSPGGAPPDSY